MTPEQIKAARQAAGLSTKTAAELIGVTQRAWQFWEKGVRAMKKPLWELFTMKAEKIVHTGPARPTPPSPAP